MNVTEMIKSRDLPALRSREEMIDILLEKEYGFFPDVPYEITVSDPVPLESRYCDSTVQYSRVEMTVTTQFGSHTFPIHRVLHTDGSVHPFFVFVNFRGNVPDMYYPTEEVGDAGFDVLCIHYNDVTKDDGDFSDGLPGIFLPEGRKNGTDCGKIMYWAWAASRVLDYAQTLPCLDKEHAAVMGHSRLGKTALVAGMLDERFRYVISNDSGCSGAALARGNSGLAELENYDPDDIFGYEANFSTGETIRDILKNFPYWFCEDYQKYLYTNIPDIFDQHFLIATIAPRYAYIASASTDFWADQTSEFLSGVAASEAYEAMGLKGLVHQEKLPEIGEFFHEGHIGYHMRRGPHFLSRHDWAGFMAFIERKRAEK